MPAYLQRRLARSRSPGGRDYHSSRDFGDRLGSAYSRRSHRQASAELAGSVSPEDFSSSNRRYSGSEKYASRRGREGYSMSASMANRVKGSSEQDRRVYVGNLAYEVKWFHLKEFMAAAGEVLFADILLLPNGRSKGCGIVEYASADSARAAIETLSNQELMGRLVFVREDRETEPKFGKPGNAAAPNGQGSVRSAGGAPFRAPAVGAPVGGAGLAKYGKPPPRNMPAPTPGTQLFIGNLPYSVSWQDLKDLFRESGTIIRTDINHGPDGRSKGTGIVLFEDPSSAADAIARFDKYEWKGRVLEVREDKFVRVDPIAGHGDRNRSIFVGNLPWSTTNEDLVDLFKIIGPVEETEVEMLPNGKSLGIGFVRFVALEDADQAIERFQGYNYGNRNLELSYLNV